MKEIEVAVVKIPVLRRSDAEKHREKLESLIKISGNMKFLKPGDSVLIKISACSPYPYPANTDPKLLGILIDLVAQKKPSVIYIGDKSLLHKNTRLCFQKTGVDDEVSQAQERHQDIPIRLITFDDYIYRERYLPEEHQRHWEFQTHKHFICAPKMLFEHDPFLRYEGLPGKVDHIIVFANIKTSKLSRFSLGMKSYLGFLDDRSRLILHRVPKKNKFLFSIISRFNKHHLQERIPELFTVITHPKLVILDGREIIGSKKPLYAKTAQPPSTHHDQPYTGVLIAGTNFLAVEAAGVSLLKSHKDAPKMIRKDPIWEMPQFKRAAELDLGARHEDKIYLHADEDDEIFHKMAWFLQ